MTTDAPTDSLAIARENARLTARTLAIWLVITLAVVGLLLAFGPAISALFV